MTRCWLEAKGANSGTSSLGTEASCIQNIPIFVICSVCIPHWKWIFDRWDLNYPEIQIMGRWCSWPLLLWPGRTCKSVPAVSLQCLRAQQAPLTRKCPVTQRSPQANIRQYLCFTVQCTSGLWHTPKFLFLLLDRSVYPDLIWVSSAPLQQEKQIESWAASAGMVLAEIEEMWSSHST